MDRILSFKLLSSDEIAAELAQRLRRKRLEKNLTQDGLASRSGVSLGILKRFESTGQIALSSFIKLAVALEDEKALEDLLLEPQFESLNDVLKVRAQPKRGRIE